MSPTLISKRMEGKGCRDDVGSGDGTGRNGLDMFVGDGMDAELGATRQEAKRKSEKRD